MLRGRWGAGWVPAIAAVLALVPAAAATAAPRAVITSGPPPDTTATTAEIAFRSSDPALVSSFECRLDGAAWSACSSPLRLGGLATGGHQVGVRMTGLLVDSTPATHAWTILPPGSGAPPSPGGSPPPGAGPPPPPGSPPPGGPGASPGVGGGGAPAPGAAPAPAVQGPPPGLTPADDRAPAPRPGRGRRLAAGGCAYGGARPGQASRRRLEIATVCLVNRERRRRGLRALRRSLPLTSGARRYARDMVRRRFFDHVTPGGRTFGQRMVASPWVRGHQWAAGEVLAWSAPDATPIRQVRNLMASPPHRRILLGREWDEVGFGVAPGAPRRHFRHAATYVGHFGRIG